MDERSPGLRLPSGVQPIYLLFVFVPASVISLMVTHHSVTTFFLSVVALVPISMLIGEATEQLSLHFGPLIGGLLNATFGNATELVIGFIGLRAGLLTMVRASITGSILGNLLLVLGMGAAAGGLKYKEQRFGKPTGGLMTTLMLLAVIGLVVPAVFVKSEPGAWTPDRTIHLSIAVSVLLLITYCLGLVFSLKTHQSLFAEQPPEPENPDSEQNEQERLPPSWTRARGLIVLLICTLLVCLESNLLVGSVEITASKLGLTQVFIGVIVIAIVGNAAEHATVVWLAYKGRMDICVNVAVGSSAQIALFVAPFLVLSSLGLAHPLTLIFSPVELVSIILAVAIAHFVALDGKTNWFEGAQLLAVYFILAAAFFFLPG